MNNEVVQWDVICFQEILVVGFGVVELKQKVDVIVDRISRLFLLCLLFLEERNN